MAIVIPSDVSEGAQRVGWLNKNYNPKAIKKKDILWMTGSNKRIPCHTKNKEKLFSGIKMLV